jgi:iron complex transport system substrate-binding protein
MVHCLGASARLVGRSHECDFPPEVQALPVVTSTRIDASQSGAQIQASVSQAIAEQQALFQLDAQQIRALQPDLILTQGQCDVCAVSPADLAKVLAEWSGPAPTVISLAPERFADLWSDLRRVGAALGLPDEGRSVISALKTRVVDVISQVARAKEKPTVACLEWLDPLMGAGNWIPELAELAGGTPVLGLAGVHSGWITHDQLLATDPDVLIGLPCGFDLARSRSALEAFLKSPRIGELKSVRTSRVYAADGNAYFNRPGPRLVDSLELLAEVLHPTLYAKPQFAGSGWVPVPAVG